jgi:hypothetical protein
MLLGRRHNPAPSWLWRPGADSRYIGGTTAGVAELADAQDLGSCGRKAVGVQIPPSAPSLSRRTETLDRRRWPTFCELPRMARDVLEQDCRHRSERSVAILFSDSRVFITMVFLFVVSLLMVPAGNPSPAPSWAGVLRDKGGKPVADAVVNLRGKLDDGRFAAKTSAGGEFSFEAIAPGSYQLTVTLGGKTYTAAN